MPVAPASHRVRGVSPGVAGIPGQSQGGGAGRGCPPWLAGHPKPQCWPCSASSPGHGGATLAAGWSCPSSARTADSPVPTCRGLPPATLKSSLHHWRGPSRMRGWSRIPPSPSSCTGSSEVGTRGPSPRSGDASEMQPGVASCLPPQLMPPWTLPGSDTTRTTAFLGQCYTGTNGEETLHALWLLREAADSPTEDWKATR